MLLLPLLLIRVCVHLSRRVFYIWTVEKEWEQYFPRSIQRFYHQIQIKSTCFPLEIHQHWKKCHVQGNCYKHGRHILFHKCAIITTMCPYICNSNNLSYKLYIFRTRLENKKNIIYNGTSHIILFFLSEKGPSMFYTRQYYAHTHYGLSVDQKKLGKKMSRCILHTKNTERIYY